MIPRRVIGRLILASVLWSVSIILNKSKSDGFDPYLWDAIFLAFRMLISLLMVFSLRAVRGDGPVPKMEKDWVSVLPFMLAGAFLATLSVMLTTTLYSEIDASVIGPMDASVTNVTTIAMAILFLGEKFSLRQGVGIILCVLSTFLNG